MAARRRAQPQRAGRLSRAAGAAQRRLHRFSGPLPTPNAPYKRLLPCEVQPWGEKTAVEFPILSASEVDQTYGNVLHVGNRAVS